MASNPNVNQVIYEGRVILDLTNDTVEPEYLLTGYTAHAKNGATIVGTYSGGGTNTADANVTASDILSGKIGYGNTGRLVGTYVPSGAPNSYVEYSNYVDGYPQDVYVHNAIMYESNSAIKYDGYYGAKNITIENAVFTTNGVPFINNKTVETVTFVNQTNPINCFHFFENCTSLKTVNMIPSAVNNSVRMFGLCSSLTEIGDIYGNLCGQNFNVSLAAFNGTKSTSFIVGNLYGTDYQYCFLNSGIYSIGNLNTVENGIYMFYNSTKLVSFGTNFQNLTNGTFMFELCSGIETIGDIIAPNIQNAAYMFSSCTKLSKVGDIYGNICASGIITTNAGPFNGCTGLTEVGDIYGYDAHTLFSYCGLTSGGFKVGNIHSSNCADMFYGSYINSIGNISNVVNGFSMFYNARKLTSVIINSPYLSNAYSMFYYATGLTSVYINSLIVANCLNCFRNTTTAKSVYLHRYYANGAESLTWTTFNAKYGSGQNGVTLVEY